MEPLSRLFIGLSVDCPWPEDLPAGRMLREEDRHLTLSFLGDQDEKATIAALEKAPSYQELAPCGYFTRVLFLPEKEARVVSWESYFEGTDTAIRSYQKELEAFLLSEHLLKKPSKQPWLAHLTLCRKPFDAKAWEASFTKLPFLVESCALYKSIGDLNYEKLWEKKWVLPFEKLPHTADLAYIIRGSSYPILFKHAQIALAFTHPPVLTYNPQDASSVQSLDDVIALLNSIVTEEDTRVGCPLKAVSYHSALQNKGNLMEWEMIIDV